MAVETGKLLEQDLKINS